MIIRGQNLTPRVLFSTVATAALCSILLPAAANAASAATNANSNAVGEIVVTARNVTERLQDVPLSITAVGSQQLQDQRIQTLKDLAQISPGLTITDEGGEFYSAPTIRGIAQTAFGGSVQNNVSTFVDGVYLSNSSIINLSVLDLNRIEVVKGPVSALYGRNAFAGAINYVNKRPSFTTYGGSIEATVGSAGTRELLASATGPIIQDKLSARIAAGYQANDGTFYDPVSALRSGGYKKKDVLFQLDGRPTDHLQFKINMYYGRDLFDEASFGYVANNCAPNAAGQFQTFCGVLPDYKGMGHPVEVPTALAAAHGAANDRKAFIGSINNSYDFGFATLESISAYVYGDAAQYNEFNHRGNEGLPFLATDGKTYSFNTFYGDVTLNADFSEELRLTSKQDQPLRWSVGGFAYTSRYKTGTRLGARNILPPGVALAAPATVENLWLTPTGAPGINQTRVRGGADQYSGFVSGDYDIIPKLTLSGQLRYTSDKELLQQRTLATTAFALNVPTPYREATYHYWNTRDTLQYKFNDDFNVYASIANGTKAGGFNPRAVFAGDIAYGPETNWTYEAGFKAQFFDRTLVVDADVFHIDWKDIQIQGQSGDPNTVGLVTKNYGKAKSEGVEIATNWRPVQGVSITDSLAYDDPKFGKGTYDYQLQALCPLIPTCAPRRVLVNAATGQFGIDVSGYRVPRSSKFTYSGGVDVNRPLADGWNYLAGFVFSYQSSEQVLVSNIASVPGRGVLNLHAGVRKDGVELMAFVRNATNNLNATIGGNNYNIRENDRFFEENPQYPEGRIYGVSVSYKY